MLATLAELLRSGGGGMGGSDGGARAASRAYGPDHLPDVGLSLGS